MSDKDVKRTQPASPSAERAVLGCIFIDNSKLNLVSQILTDRDFYYPKHALLYRAMLSLSASREPIDYTTLEEYLKKEKSFDEIGGMDFLLSITEEPYLLSNLDSYVNIVKKNSTLRDLILFGEDIRRKSQDASEDPDAILEAAESRLVEITKEKKESGLVVIRESIEDTLKRISDLSVNRGKLTGIPTGFRDLDKQLSGLQRSDLVLLAARPSMGKTALGVNMAYHAARYEDEKGDHPYKVAIFSLEMSKLQLGQRLLSAASGIDLQKIISGDLFESDDWALLLKGVEKLKSLQLYIDDTSSLSIQDLRSKCRRMKIEKGLDLIVIDYLQLMTVDDSRRSDNRQQEITTISRGLKGLAKELNCPVLALSQLSRKAESREGARPLMSDMRESGAIEQDADVVMLLYREDYYNSETDKPNITEVNIAKHRNGPTGTVNLYFKKEQTMFVDIDYSTDPNA